MLYKIIFFLLCFKSSFFALASWGGLLINHNGSRVLHVDKYLLRLKELSRRDSANIQEFPITTINEREVNAYILGNKSAKTRIFIGAGVHGKEELSPIIAMYLISNLRKHKELLKNVCVTIVPLINSFGHRYAVRGAKDSEDLNRSFIKESKSRVASELMKWLHQEQGYDLAIDLHGKRSSSGFFAIKAADDFGLAKNVLSSVPAHLLFQSDNGVYPGFRSDSEGKDPYRYSLESPGLATSSNTGTLKNFLLTKSKYSYTIEYPGMAKDHLAVNWGVEILKKFIYAIHASKQSQIAFSSPSKL